MPNNTPWSAKNLDGGGTVFHLQNGDYNTPRDGTTDAYTSMASCHTAATASGGFITGLPGTYLIGSDLTINANVALFLPPGVILKPDTGVTLTVNGPIMSGHWQIFDDSVGTVDLTDYRGGEISVHWFGDASTDIGACFNSALAAIDYASVSLNRRQTLTFAPASASGSWPLLTKIDMDGASQVRIKGPGRMQGHMEIGASLGIVGLSAVGSDECEFEDFRITEASGSVLSTCMQITGTSVRLRNLWFGNAYVGLKTSDGSGGGCIGEFSEIVIEACTTNYNISGNTRKSTFTACQSNNDQGSAFLIQSDGTAAPQRIALIGCRANGNGDVDNGIGFEQTGGSHVVYDACYAIDCGLEGFSITGSGSSNQLSACAAYDCGVQTKSAALEIGADRTVVTGFAMRDTANTMQGIDILAAADRTQIWGFIPYAVEDFDLQDAGTYTCVNGTYYAALSGGTPSNNLYREGSTVVDTDTGNAWVMQPTGSGTPTQIA